MLLEGILIKTCTDCTNCLTIYNFKRAVPVHVKGRKRDRKPLIIVTLGITDQMPIFQ